LPADPAGRPHPRRRRRAPDGRHGRLGLQLPAGQRAGLVRARRRRRPRLAGRTPAAAPAAGRRRIPGAMSAAGRADWHGMRVIARGANRVCVLDPDQPGHCLKYELRPTPGMRRYWRRRLRHALSRWFPRLGLNAIELDAWRRLRARLGDAMDPHVAPCAGIVETRAGPALRARLVADAAGDPAPTIAALLDDRVTAFDPAAVARALDHFEAWLLAHRVPLSDLNAGNLA